MVIQALSADFATLREQLRARATSLRADVQQHREQLVEPAAATGNTFIAGAEGAAADADDEREVALLSRAQQELDAVNAALQRLDSGSFGTCTRCAATIQLARLQALPEAQLCLNCQRAAERP
ncbi:MAG: TraR/DksA C4-type zinc finger protein [Burkholderiaceae bacterium]